MGVRSNSTEGEKPSNENERAIKIGTLSLENNWNLHTVLAKWRRRSQDGNFRPTLFEISPVFYWKGRRKSEEQEMGILQNAATSQQAKSEDPEKWESNPIRQKGRETHDANEGIGTKSEGNRSKEEPFKPLKQLQLTHGGRRAKKTNARWELSPYPFRDISPGCLLERK
ncbi:hypothetical protein ACJRO7_001976 [Eucalyptus globulus]|uniref:Uncharacterized protein n=1 Tax=Eucalyptus globulus TaxID=34317 RepID=A0ABD3LYA9_EUCGL